MFQANLAWHSCQVSDFAKLEQEFYTSTFIPVRSIREEVTRFAQSNGICDGCSFHIRRTDLTEPDRTSDEKFEAAIANCTGRVFISTDNPDTRKRFQEKFPGKVIYYGVMPDTLQENSFRFTNLRHSLTEAFIASRAKKFMGTYLSSWSEAIDSFHRQCQLVDCCHHPEKVWPTYSSLKPD